MNILILNGSPKGNKMSVSNRHVEYIKKHFPDHEYKTVAVAQKIRKIEKDDDFFQSVIEDMKQAELIVWSFPIYLYLVPAQLKRFIEILYEKAGADLFSGIYSTSVSTSIMIHDYPAHNYIQAVCEDFNMNYLPGFSFDAAVHKEILKKKNREAFRQGFENIFKAIETRRITPQQFQKIEQVHHEFTQPELQETAKSGDRKILIITDGKPGSNLDKMVRLFADCSDYESETINLNDIEIKSGCIGCLQCQFEGKCVIGDDVRSIYLDKMMNADCVVMAATIKDRHYSAFFKQFIDRGYFTAQVPRMKGKYISWLVSGPLRQCHLASQFQDIFASNRFMTHLGCVSDEYEDSRHLFELIRHQAGSVDTYIRTGLTRPQTCFSRAYHLMLRETLAILTSIKTAAYKHYKKHGLMDFPHKSLKLRLRGLMYNIAFNMPIVKTRLRKKISSIHFGFYDSLFREKTDG